MIQPTYLQMVVLHNSTDTPKMAFVVFIVSSSKNVKIKNEIEKSKSENVKRKQKVESISEKKWTDTEGNKSKTKSETKSTLNQKHKNQAFKIQCEFVN